MNIPALTPDFNGQPLTMSSREIAELCGKRHDHVLRDIEKTLQDLGDPKSGASDFECEYTIAQNKKAKEYRLPKDLSLLVVSGYSVKLRKRIIDRWIELEEGAPKLTCPQLMAASLIEAQNTLKAQAQQIEDMREDVEAHDRLIKADGAVPVTDAAKNLGMRPKDLFQWLSQNGWIYKRTGSTYWLGYQAKCNGGLLEHKTTVVYRADGSEKVTEQVRVTARGLSRLARVVPGVAQEVQP